MTGVSHGTGDATGPPGPPAAPSAAARSRAAAAHIAGAAGRVVPVPVRRRASGRAPHAAAIRWQPSQVPVRPWGPLAARAGGPDGRPVALLHGLAASNRVWSGAYDRLAEGGRLVVPDMRGFGASPRPPSGYTLAAHADAVAGCLDAAGASQPAVLAGHSFGALVALTLARRHPDRVRGLLLLSPPLFAGAASARARTRAALSRLERVIAMDTAVAGALCRSVCSARPRLAQRLALMLRPELPEPVARDGVSHSWSSYSESLGELLAARARPEWLGELDVPVHMITGVRDLLPDLDLLRGLANRHRNVNLEVVDECDHLLPLTHPDRCLAAVEGLRGGWEALA